MKITWEETNKALTQNGWTGARITNLMIEINRTTPRLEIINWETLNIALTELNVPTAKIANILQTLKRNQEKTQHEINRLKYANFK
jgi:hypothetical protein